MKRSLLISFVFSLIALGACKEVTPDPVVPPEPEPPVDPVVLLCTDTPLTLALDQAPVLGDAGCIKVFRTDTEKQVDCIDLADKANVIVRESDGAMIPVSQINKETLYHSFLDALPSGGRYRPVHYTPLRINGNNLEIKLHSNVLEFDKEYMVTVDAGFIAGHPGIPAGEWTFKTKAKPASRTELNVNADGSADFCTVQGALTYAGSLGQSAEVSVNIAEGTYREMLYLRNKNKLTLKGAGRDKTVILYPNNESYSTGSGAGSDKKPEIGKAIGVLGGRGLMLVENCNDLTLEDLTIENSFGELKGQAETIYFNSGDGSHLLTVERCNLISFQDTFLCKGKVYVHNSLIAGHCDYIWGYPAACLFHNCEIRSRAAGYIVQARINKPSDKGFVFLDCQLTAEAGVANGSMYLARSGGQSTAYDNVTFVNCTMGPVIAAKGWYENPAPNPSTPNATSGWKEYGSVDTAGNPVSHTSSYGRVLTGNEAEAFASRKAVLGY